MRRRVHGVGIMDAKSTVVIGGDGKESMCRYYQTWANMLKRCYSGSWKKAHPTYAKCTTCEEWLLFSRFKAWMQSQDWEGKSLDKDILSRGNKIYSPETCIFVTHKINTLLTDTGAKRGRHEQGVSYHKREKKFIAQIRMNGRINHLGYFQDETEAADAYNNAKAQYIYEIAQEQVEPLKSALLRHSDYWAIKSINAS